MPLKTLLEQGEDLIQATKDTKPSQFTIGGTWQRGKVAGGVTFDRTWKNGWGATAYARAWWNDQAVVPDAHKLGGEVGFGAIKKY